MKVINPRGVEIDVPDSWAGPQLQQMIAQGYQVVQEKVFIPTPEVVKVETKLQDPKPLEEVKTDDRFADPVIPDEKIRILRVDGQVKRLDGYGHLPKQKPYKKKGVK